MRGQRACTQTYSGEYVETAMAKVRSFQVETKMHSILDRRVHVRKMTKKRVKMVTTMTKKQMMIKKQMTMMMTTAMKKQMMIMMTTMMKKQMMTKKWEKMVRKTV
jgi:hypothetical protein